MHERHYSGEVAISMTAETHSSRTSVISKEVQLSIHKVVVLIDTDDEQTNTASRVSMTFQVTALPASRFARSAVSLNPP